MVSWRPRRRSPRRERVRIRIRTSCVLPSDRRVLLRCKVAAAITPACPPPCAQRVIAHWYAQCLIRFASPVIPHACLQPSPCCCALTKRLHWRRPTGLLTWEGKHGDDDQWLFLTGNATRQALIHPYSDCSNSTRPVTLPGTDILGETPHPGRRIGRSRFDGFAQVYIGGAPPKAGR